MVITVNFTAFNLTNIQNQLQDPNRTLIGLKRVILKHVLTQF